MQITKFEITEFAVDCASRCPDWRQQVRTFLLQARKGHLFLGDIELEIERLDKFVQHIGDNKSEIREKQLGREDYGNFL